MVERKREEMKRIRRRKKKKRKRRKSRFGTHVWKFCMDLLVRKLP